MHRKKIIKLVSLVFFSAISQSAFCQNTLNVSSHSATINGATFDYSIGEMTLVSTERNANLIVTQGLLQPNGSRSGTQAQPGNTPIAGSDVMKVYPNPTENILNVESFESVEAEISYQLFDATGKVVFNEKVMWHAGSNKVSLNLKNYAAGSYYLMIRKPNASGILENFSYKIQKTN
ncbi:MAG: T9SS type A sorting domain-containing protein [Bacteroidetes bacterium]|nr:T9SS type A sorting domain-containing protein [Bacteroidota bacterium]MBK8145779.1 T9SS type A sorting domain-containing protein [Bacteroidota bacterium]